MFGKKLEKRRSSLLDGVAILALRDIKDILASLDLSKKE